MAPKVSICIATRNRTKFLRLTLESILMQDFRDYEVLICDDASSDDTLRVIKHYSTLLPKVEIFCNDKRKGAVYNHNLLTSLATGKYVIYPHDDNIMGPNLLSTAVRLLEARPDCSMFIPLSSLIDINGKTIYEQRSLQLGPRIVSGRVFIYNFIPPFKLPKGTLPYRRLMTSFPSTVYRTDLVEKAGRFDYDLPVSFDLLLEAKLCLLGDVIFLDKTLFQYRLHQNWGHVISRSATHVRELTILYRKLFLFMSRYRPDVLSENRREIIDGLIEYCSSFDGPVTGIAWRYQGNRMEKFRRMIEVGKLPLRKGGPADKIKVVGTLLIGGVLTLTPYRVLNITFPIAVKLASH